MIRVIQTQSGRSLLRLSLISQTSKASLTSAPAVTASQEVSGQAAYHVRIGNRDIVGFGLNGRPQYFDHPSCPLPSVRWSAKTDEFLKLKEKAKGDWANLTIEEKKALYRGDFCQTLSEVQTKGLGDWKFTLGMVLGFIGVSMWTYCFVSKLIYDYPRLQTSSIEHQTRMLERMIAEGKGKLHGPASQWDYEKGDWKSK